MSTVRSLRGNPQPHHRPKPDWRAPTTSPVDRAGSRPTLANRTSKAVTNAVGAIGQSQVHSIVIAPIFSIRPRQPTGSTTFGGRRFGLRPRQERDRAVFDVRTRRARNAPWLKQDDRNWTRPCLRPVYRRVDQDIDSVTPILPTALPAKAATNRPGDRIAQLPWR